MTKEEHFELLAEKEVEIQSSIDEVSSQMRKADSIRMGIGRCFEDGLEDSFSNNGAEFLDNSETISVGARDLLTALETQLEQVRQAKNKLAEEL